MNVALPLSQNQSMMLKPGDSIQRPKSSNAFSSIANMKRKMLNSGCTNRNQTFKILKNEMELGIRAKQFPKTR
jgi:hypothetical protein